MVIPLAALGTYLLVRSAVEGALGVALAIVLATVVSLLHCCSTRRSSATEGRCYSLPHGTR
jgi:hypothetical protein